MNRRLVIQLAITVGICAAPTTHAHHSHPNFYDGCKSISIEGRVESVQWVDPHTVIVVRLADKSAFTVDWSGLRGLTNTGIIAPAREALVPGVRVAVNGNPIRTSAEIRQRSPDFTGEVNPNTVDPTLIRRVDDTWSWARTPGDTMPASPAPPCADATRK